MKNQTFEQILEQELFGTPQKSSTPESYQAHSPLETPTLELGWDIDLSFQVRLRKKAASYQSSMTAEMRQAKRKEQRQAKMQKLPIYVQVAWMNLCDYAQEAGLGEWEMSEAKSLFRRLALKFHPDHCQSPTAVETFRQILSDYGIVCEALGH